MKAACSNFFSADSPGIEAMRRKLPTGLVDRRICQGGLKYPNEDFYSIFAGVERAYSKVVTPDNFMSRSGLLLSEIKGSLQHNKILREHFGLLLGKGHSFSQETIDTVYQFLIKVFCNLRAKDVALKYILFPC